MIAAIIRTIKAIFSIHILVLAFLFLFAYCLFLFFPEPYNFLICFIFSFSFFLFNFIVVNVLFRDFDVHKSKKIKKEEYRKEVYNLTKSEYELNLITLRNKKNIKIIFTLIISCLFILNISHNLETHDFSSDNSISIILFLPIYLFFNFIPYLSIIFIIVVSGLIILIACINYNNKVRTLKNIYQEKENLTSINNN